MVSCILSERKQNILPGIEQRSSYSLFLKLWILLTDGLRRVGEKRIKYIFGVFDETMDAEAQVDAARLAVRVVNEAMRRIVRKLDIKNRATTVVARHTWSTILMKNNVPVSYISKGLGHTSISTTEKYFGDFDQDQKKEVGEIIASIGKKTK